MFKVGIKRTESEAVVTIKTGVSDEKVFKFSLSPIITKQSLKLIIPMLIKSEREKRIKTAITSAKTKATRAANKAEREAKKEANEIEKT